MLKDDLIEITTTGKNIKYYQDLGYDCGYRTTIRVKQSDLPKSSNKLVNVICDYCGETFQAKNQDLNRKTIIEKDCCKKCSYKKIEEGNYKKYGVKSYMATDEFKESNKQYLINTYNTDNVFKVEKFKEKQKNTNLLKYGVENVFQSTEIKEKIKTTLLDKYGVDNPLKSKTIQEKVEKTCFERYGVKTPFENEEIKEKIKNTMQNKYSVDYPLQNYDINKKQRDTMLNKYGKEYPSQVFQFKEKLTENMRKTNKERYGFEVASKNKEVAMKIKISTMNTLYKNGNVISSKNQRYLCDLYGGELNYLFNYYFLDIYFKESNIYCEYDGSGHDLNVKLGSISKEEFIIKEIIRYKILKSKGLKLFKIVHKNKKLPSDKTLLYIKNIAFQYLFATNNNWIIFDIDNNVIKTKYKTTPYNYINMNIKI